MAPPNTTPKPATADTGFIFRMSERQDPLESDPYFGRLLQGSFWPAFEEDAIH